MGREKPLTDLGIQPEGAPDAEMFVKILRGSRGENDIELIELVQDGSEKKVMDHIKSILHGMGLSEKNATGIYDKLSKRLEFQHADSYSKEVMDKIMDGFRASIENTIRGYRG